ncbi:MAG: hypothetical protein Q8M96_15400, partial [Rubrivivax sp.]|nr:hypothetical protein [Rubrivivax sp.]
MTAGGTGLARAWAALGLAWLMGCALQLQMSALWPAWWMWLLLSQAVVLTLVGWRWRQTVAGLLLLSLAALALGFASTHGRA